MECLTLFRHFMVDVIISSSHGYRQGALSKWILGGMDPIATAISDFPKRGIVVGSASKLPPHRADPFTSSEVPCQLLYGT